MRQQHRSIQVQTLLQHIVFIQKPLTAFMIFTPFLFPISLVGILSLYAISVNPFLPVVTVHACVPSNGICRGFAFKYGKFLLPPRFLTALSVPKVPPREHTVSSQKKVYWIFVILTTPLLADYNHFTAVDSRHSRLKHIPFYHLRRFYHDIQDKGSLFP